MTTTIYHGGRVKPVSSKRTWATEDLTYAREYRDIARITCRTAGLWRRTVDLTALRVVDLRSAGLCGRRAAMLLAEAGIETSRHYDEPHLLIEDISDAQFRAAGIDAVQIIESTDGIEAETICFFA